MLWHEHKNERSQHESENAENVECELFLQFAEYRLDWLAGIRLRSHFENFGSEPCFCYTAKRPLCFAMDTVKSWLGIEVLNAGDSA
ncbi:hypothetical protein NDU88_002756 [Pleurodeles waltl]|uniref:Uncharacterized protein n=1 Tax=Pleurodeles waltl TaxID=8319 RepID=A0AAV7WR57_PLEWA|nr:hypothetical protein NDU88_002756 [Pleurodeles waltl]